MAVSINIGITQNSQSVTDNTSNVTVNVTASWTYGSNNRTGQCTGSLTIDGTPYSFSGIKFNTGQTTSGSQVIMTKTVNIRHASDGSKTLVCSASFVTGVSSGTVSASASKVLTTIPRKSTLSVGNGTLGTAQTLTVTRQSSGFTHTVAYSCGNVNIDICKKSTDTSISFTPPLSLASQNTTGTSVSITYTITTYNGNTNLGSNSYTKSCSIPSSVKPSVSIEVSDAMGYAEKYGAYIQGQSKIKVSLSAAGSYGSTIKSYKTTVDGKTYTAASFTTDAINGKGTLTINSTVTDSRTRTGTDSASLTVIDYAAPKFTAFSVYRCDAEGNNQKNGAYLAVKFGGMVAALNNKNSAIYTVQYKKTSEPDTAYISETLDDYENNYSFSDGLYIFPADTSVSYNVKMTISDDFNTGDKSISRSAIGSSVFKLWSMWKGIGLALGKIAEGAGLEVALDTNFRKSVSGTVFGLDELPLIPDNSDFNDYINIGCYAVYTHVSSRTMSNIPVQQAGRLIVSSGTGSKMIDKLEWSYIHQEYIPLSPDIPIYKRLIQSDGDKNFTYGEWIPQSAHGGKVLWSGAYFMTKDHTCTLSEPISAQQNGIVLVFSTFEEGQAGNAGFNSFFVHKKLVDLHGGCGHSFFMGGWGSMQNWGHKYLYIHDTSISGNEYNGGTQTGNIPIDNNSFVLRYVIGV